MPYPKKRTGKKLILKLKLQKSIELAIKHLLPHLLITNYFQKPFRTIDEFHLSVAHLEKNSTLAL